MGSATSFRKTRESRATSLRGPALFARPPCFCGLRSRLLPSTASGKFRSRRVQAARVYRMRLLRAVPRFTTEAGRGMWSHWEGCCCRNAARWVTRLRLCVLHLTSRDRPRFGDRHEATKSSRAVHCKFPGSSFRLRASFGSTDYAPPGASARGSYRARCPGCR